MPASTPRFSRDFYLVTIANFVFFLNFASFFLLPLHLKSLGVSERTIGFVMGTGGFAGLCVMPFLGALLDRVSRRGFVTTGALAMALASYAYLLLHGAGGFIYVLRVVQGVSFTCAFVTASTLAVELAPASRRGEALGIFGISTLTTHAIAPALGVRIVLGGLSDRVGRHRVLLPSIALLACAVVALGWVRSMAALVTVGLLFGAGQGMVYPTANALMVDLSHPGNLGRVQTLFSGSFSVGVAVSA